MFSNPIKRAASQGLSASFKMASLRATQMSNMNRMAMIKNFGSSNKGAFRASTGLNKPMSAQDNFVNGTSAVYVDGLYE